MLTMRKGDIYYNAREEIRIKYVGIEKCLFQRADGSHGWQYIQAIEQDFFPRPNIDDVREVSDE